MTPPEPPLIKLTGLGRSYAQGATETVALRDVDLDIHAGEFVALLGQSGSGKTTLMNIIGLLDRASRGTYVLAGQDVSQLDPDERALLRRDRFGFVFQHYNLVATSSALENVEMPAFYAGTPAEARRSRAQGLLGRLGLGQRLRHRPAELSGGQQQRVAIARALMNGGAILLADEPTGALDSQSGAEVMELLRDLHRAGHTILLVTHSETLAAQADRRIKIHDGRIVADSGRVSRAADLPALPAPLGRGLSFIDTIRLSVHALHANMFRTALTLIGIVIGVASVIAMLAVGNGEKQALLTRFATLGPDLITVSPGARNLRSSDGTIATLVDGDRLAIMELPGLGRATAEYATAVTVRAVGGDVRSTARSTTPELPDLRSWPLARGAFFTQDDVDAYASVVVLGQTVTRNLFGDADPVGQYLQLNNMPFQVIGELTARGASGFGPDQDDVVYLPLSTGRLKLHGQRHVQNIVVQVADTDRIAAAEQMVSAVLESRHATVDFQIRNAAQFLAVQTASRDGATMMLGAIALISLLVGGIGVMNIMLVSVTERTREIGVRMAAGARRKDILLQFTAEALAVTAFGGLVGVATGFGVAWILGMFGRPILVVPGSVVLALGSACLAGLVFGYWPARKAAGLDPVRALMAE
ncbi:MacB family efflux pump subunit [Humitalea sp. 24SJ18S-53]|uniref:MacB family efflux pump subunit n=1 Tax=Humitalea sp. 24SJ18S-53 TaxID=3422307 RepID=UPI003D673A24